MSAAHWYILLPPIDDCTGRRLRLLAQAFQGISHNDPAVPRKGGCEPQAEPLGGCEPQPGDDLARTGY